MYLFLSIVYVIKSGHICDSRSKTRRRIKINFIGISAIIIIIII